MYSSTTTKVNIHPKGGIRKIEGARRAARFLTIRHFRPDRRRFATGADPGRFCQFPMPPDSRAAGFYFLTTGLMSNKCIIICIFRNA